MEISWNFVSPKKWEPCWIIFDMNYWKFGMTDNRVQIDKIQNDPGGWSAYVTCPSGWEAGLISAQYTREAHNSFTLCHNSLIHQYVWHYADL